MTLAVAIEPAVPRVPRRLLFTATIFAGSFLLFLIQPMIARIALPRLGGAPAVWNSAMLVYQALLLGGYAYAHWLTRFPARTQALTHLGLFAVAGLFLPIGLSSATPPSDANVFLWVPWLLLASIGPLFFVISAHAPLLQRWFALTSGDDPYPLYAASNLGSFGGLIAYPLLLEPVMTVTAQRWLWTAGYGLLFLLLVGCLMVVRTGRAVDVPVAEAEAPAEPIATRSILRWIWLGFIPSGLMLSTTLFITTDIMAMPLLWVIPLSLYLLSFTIAFSSRGTVARFISMLAPFLLVPAAASLFIGSRIPLHVSVAVLLIALFAISVACHHEVYRTRPDPRRLTGFYVALSIGGVLGGLFCALIAPLIFDWTYEYPLLMLAAALTLVPERPLLPLGRWLSRPAGRVIATAIASASVVAALAIAVQPENGPLVRYGVATAIAIGLLAVGSRVLLTITLVAVMVMAGGIDRLKLSATPGRMTRTYFGIYSIVEGNGYRQLLHGTTLHGVQLLTRGWERTPTTYYGRESGVGRALLQAPAMFGSDARVSIVGLGTGTLACYRRDGQRWTFFELDPAVVDLATNPERFSFVPQCSPDARMVVGDARIELARQPAGSADVLVVDAFSSDAVPMHLLTQEAYALYGRHLAPDGLLLMHISNRHLDLEPVVAAAPGWHSLVGRARFEWDHRQQVGSEWVVLSRSPQALAALRNADRNFWLQTTDERRLWTDDYASLLSVLR